ncbi:MAG: monovalent cation/H+ antiporter subunit D family protein [Pseudomonadota bacterium]
MTITELMPFGVLVPLIAAPICALMPGRFLPWLTAMIAALLSVLIMAQVLPAATDEPLRYAFGNWPPPIGIEFRVDAVNGFIGLLVSLMATVILPWARISVNQEIPERQGLFYALFLLAFSGLMGITLTGDAFNLFVFLEISSLSTYALVAMGRPKTAPLAAFRYLIMGTLGATFYLIGVGLLYIMTGTLNMADLAERLPEVADTRAVQAGFAFIVVGIGVKLALFPLHRWLPGAYANAPSAITVFLSSTATKVAVYTLLRLVFTVFGVGFAAAMPYAEVFFVLGIFGILMASLWTIQQDNLKRLLAYSSVAQIGYIILGISLLSVTGLAAGLVHLFNHAIIKAALFMVVCTVIYQTGSARISAFEGLGRQMPLTMLAFVLAGLGLIGVPLTAGFISKWMLIQAAIEQDLWLAVVVILVGSLMAVIYIGKVAEAAWLKPPAEGRASVSEARLGLLIPMYLLVFATYYFGIDTRLTLDFALIGANALMGATP